MTGILDYIKWRGDITLQQSPFNEVDALIFSEFTYLKLEGIVPSEHTKNGISIADAAAAFFASKDFETRSQTGLFINATLLELFQAMSKCPRYAQMMLCGFDNKLDSDTEKQFAALTIMLEKDSFLVVYRGTDDSLVGWKEDFNMMFQMPVPAQTEALDYINRAAQALRGKIRVAGHSKGGNLAVYASTFCGKRIQNRIVEIYNNDGPGFVKGLTETAEFKAVQNRLTAFTPQNSVFGLLLEHNNELQVVKSKGDVIKQHDPFSWEVLGTKIVRADTLDEASLFFDKTVRNWFDKVDNTQRAQFVESLYTILEDSGASTLSELSVKWAKHPAKLIKTLLSVDEHSREIIWKCIQQLFASAHESFPSISQLLKLEGKK